MRKQGIRCEISKGQYRTGEAVAVHVIRQWEAAEEGKKIGKPKEAAVYLLQKPLAWPFSTEETEDGFDLVLEGLPKGRYGLRISWEDVSWETAFDLVDDPGEAVRYGFVSDFGPEDRDDEDIRSMAGLHLSAVQFYDWMYRHDDLVAASEVYEDPMGRLTDRESIRVKAEACRRLGMRPFAYGAVYAATRETFLTHPEWALYTMDGEPMRFAGWLYYMNPSEQSGWQEHLIAEYKKAARELSFQGIHMDTYGFPKLGWDRDGCLVNLEQVFPQLIRAAAQAMKQVEPENGVIFNAVNNWPIPAVASSCQDAAYIEVWPPYDSYYDLYTLIREAKLFGGRQVILAAYMKPFAFAAGGENGKAPYQREQTDKKAKDPEIGMEEAEYSFLLANAVIQASGGTQLALGEKGGILCDSYYVNYAGLRPAFFRKVQSYCDYLVWYSDLLYDNSSRDITRTAAGGINEDICFLCDGVRVCDDGRGGAVWAVIKETDCRLIIHLINLTGNNNQWNQPKRKPETVRDLKIRIRVDRKVTGAWTASPDRESLRASELAVVCDSGGQGRIYCLTLSRLEIFTTVWLEME